MEDLIVLLYELTLMARLVWEKYQMESSKQNFQYILWFKYRNDKNAAQNAAEKRNFEN